MPGRLTLTAVDGPLQGKIFTFDEHDTFIFGRSSQCHARLPDDDKTASRHHFVLELNPPQACVRDLGSLNGTHVNGRQIGRRAKGESPQDAALRVQPTVPLNSGDTLRVGHSVFKLHAETLLTCPECGTSLGQYAEAGRPPKVPLLCSECRERTRALDRPSVEDDERTRLQCRHCCRPAAQAGLCDECREQGERDPVGFLLTGLQAKAMADAPRPKAAGAPGSIPGYTLGRELGAGGMGRVVQATRQTDGAQVAIKVMLSQVAVDESARRMFAREIETTRVLRHPHIVEFIDSGSAGEAFYVVLEFCSEGSLADHKARRGGRLSLDELAPLMMDALAGLAHAHGHGFVHRDIKPHNILLTRGPQRLIAKIADMGLSKSFAKAGLSGMTATGGYAGSFPFMPAEQLTNFKFAKPSGDVWSFGATFYHLLTGQAPRAIRPGQDPIAEILRGEVVAVRERLPTLPAAVAAVIDRSLAPAVPDRYASAAEMREALGKALHLP